MIGQLLELEIAVPVYQMLLFVAVVLLCLAFSRFKLGLMITFCFTFYWGFVYNKELFIETEGITPFFFFYIFSGFLLITCALTAFFKEEE